MLTHTKQKICLHSLLNYVFIFMWFVPLIFLTSCQKTELKHSQSNLSFDDFTNSIFLSQIQSDSITLNYNLSEPEKYGITDTSPSLGQYSLEAMKESLVYNENCLSILKSYDYKSLDNEQKLIYDLLLDSFTIPDNMEDLLLYRECLGPTSGFQAQLPILLAEYNFYTKEDIETYLELLSLVYDYFEEIVTFEQEKSKAGLFMADETANAIIEQCTTFIAEPNENFLVDIFEDKINAFPNLSSKQKQAYLEKNETMILEKLIPAYQLLIDSLTSLKGTGTNQSGLSHFPKGKQYYEYLLEASTGSSRSVKEIDKLLDDTFQSCILKMAKIANKDESIFKKFTEKTYPLTEPNEIITYLESAIETDFPKLNSVHCTIKYVHPSLQEHLSPAFYLTPPIDNFLENSIYINGGKDYDLSGIFPTIAHEGYPGHLYQTVYFSQQSPNPIRHIFNYGGYSEGWATYAEIYSYSISGFDPNLTEFAVSNLISTLCMYAKADIGINYYGWDLSDTANYLNSCGVSNETAISSVYRAMIEEPCSYMKYTLGYLEFKALREKAEDKLGKNFSALNFHKFLLDLGPCSFDILNNRLDIWLNSQ